MTGILPRLVTWICGDGGYIYKLVSLPAGVSVEDTGDASAGETLRRIHMLEETIVSVGDNGYVVASENRGETFAATDTLPSGNQNSAISVVDDFIWWLGDQAGGVYYTNDQGDSWASFPLDSTAATIEDIVFATDEVGWISYSTSDPTAKIMTTYNGGADWTSDNPRIINYPTFDRGNRVAVPDVPNPNIASNNIAIAGLAGDGSDGIILQGKPSVV